MASRTRDPGARKRRADEQFAVQSLETLQILEDMRALVGEAMTRAGGLHGPLELSREWLARFFPAFAALVNRIGAMPPPELPRAGAVVEDDEAGREAGVDQDMTSADAVVLMNRLREEIARLQATRASTGVLATRRERDLVRQHAAFQTAIARLEVLERIGRETESLLMDLDGLRKLSGNRALAMLLGGTPDGGAN